MGSPHTIAWIAGLHERLLACRWTHVRVARLLGVSESAVTAWVWGRQVPYRRNQVALARVLSAEERRRRPCRTCRALLPSGAHGNRRVFCGPECAAVRPRDRTGDTHRRWRYLQERQAAREARRLCRVCAKPLRRDARANVRYHSQACAQTWCRLRNATSGKTAARYKVRRTARLGRRCKWCARTDLDGRGWGVSSTECSRCQRQRLRRPCNGCGGPTLRGECARCEDPPTTLCSSCGAPTITGRLCYSCARGRPCPCGARVRVVYRARCASCRATTEHVYQQLRTVRCLECGGARRVVSGHTPSPGKRRCAAACES